MIRRSVGERALHCMACLLAMALGMAVCQPARGEDPAKQPPPRKLRIVVVGAHPDDPESGAGGLITSLSRAGHDVIVAYMACFRADRKCFGRPEAEVRHKEAADACKIMGATPKFFPYGSDKLTDDAATAAMLGTWLKEVKPDIVVAHWPFDTHPNHCASSSLVWQCYSRDGGWNLYLFEVETGVQAIGFHPQFYLDIGAVRTAKEQACLCHKSQNPRQFWWPLHEKMQRDRGAECGVQYAEGYSLIEAKAGCALLPLPLLPPRH
jgi:N-acetylglucosamine malate deacetylase 1